MSDLSRFYKTKLPGYFLLFAIVGCAMAAGIFGSGLFSIFWAKPVISATSLDQLGHQGDFFGGHFSAIVGLLTLLVVGAGFFIERQESRRFALREQFAQAMSLIISSFEESPKNAKPSVMTWRLLNYYARVALAHPEDTELIIMLNVGSSTF